MRLPAVGSLVLVTWEDAHVQPSAGDEMPEPTIVETVGWLVAKDRKGLLVAPERMPRGCAERWRIPTRIPRGMIRDITRICSGG